ncbi:MAG: glycine--tRNA ligase subunit beta [Sphingorhabdus sp.]|nr:glycine--tRNA ligase subunit beta [Sphingorhabdus sp.]
MTDFLLELRSEEIPARMQAKAKDDLVRLFTEALAKAGLAAETVEAFATPRRLALIAKGLPLETQAVSEETKGPKVGAPPQAMEGFLRKTGLNEDQLVERDGVYFAVVEKPGRKTADVLAEAIPAIIRAFPWPKSQRWGAASASTESLRWVRPLQGIIALLGDDVVACEIDGIVSGRETMGHRFHSTGPVEIANAAAYVEALRAAHVIVHYSERTAIIRDGAAAAAKAAGLTLVEDEGLVAENAGLTEWPVPMLGRFDPAFLEVPQEVIQLTARVNQKYFVCHDKSGKLANAFVCTANIVANDGGAAIVAGNEKVLAARLSDAKFFWEQDLKIPLDEQAKKLSQITFHEKLGTVADKVERVAKLARWLVEEGIVKSASADDAERAARLCKADLVTGMVGEFPELQGLMGGYYARAQGEADAVADAVRDHYKPVGQGDDVPTAPVTVAVSLADKLDTLVGFFQIDEKPTGSKDPFALRRAAIGILSLILENDLRVSMRDLITAAAHAGGSNAGLDIANFLIDRLKVQQRDAGIRHDMIDAVVAVANGGDNVLMVKRVKALQGFVGTDEGANLLAGYKRAANILKQAEGVDPNAAAPADLGSEEQALLSALDSAEPKAVAAIEAEQFEDAMAALASLRAPIDAFFDGVMVNDPDPEKRAFRLGLLARFRDAVSQVADFSKIEG